MAITADKLRQRFGSQLVLGRPMQLVLAWEVVHTEWVPETVVKAGFEQKVVKDLDRIGDVDGGLQAVMRARLFETQDENKPMAAIRSQSLADVQQIWDRWAFIDHGDGTMTGTHPVCGEFTGPAENTPVGRVNGILGVCLPPPAWAWFDSVAVALLRTKCVRVIGADHYAVYAESDDGGFEHLGDVPDEGVQSLAVPPGSYVVRMGAVNGSGRVGVLSRPQVVDVLGGESTMVSPAVVSLASPGDAGRDASMAEREAVEFAGDPAEELDGVGLEASLESGPGRWERFKAWLRGIFKRDEAVPSVSTEPVYEDG